ncbi:MAG: helix-turn-helix domain-containing protein [Chitinophagaceae bacterium]
MKQTFTDVNTGGKFIMITEADCWEQVYYQQKKGFSAHTIAWNRGATTTVFIDEVPFVFKANTILPIMLNQSFRFDDAQGIIAWQFDKNFYCLANHDAEVGCYGFLFFAPIPTMFITLDDSDTKKVEAIALLFEEEFHSSEEIKGEMLRMLLVRLIIQLTRIAKKQYITVEPQTENFNLMRQFNFLVEQHFKQQHQVKFYASLLHKSPKTIANIFTLYSSKTPLQIIHERIITEANRLLLYTNKSIKEIAYDIGFSDPTHFSKFFKKQTQQNPSDFVRIKNHQSI